MDDNGRADSKGVKAVAPAATKNPAENKKAAASCRTPNTLLPKQYDTRLITANQEKLLRLNEGFGQRSFSECAYSQRKRNDGGPVEGIKTCYSAAPLSKRRRPNSETIFSGESLLGRN